MNEADLVQKLMKSCQQVMPGCVTIKHFDHVTAGIPDISVTWGRRTVWVEVKYGDLKVRESQKVLVGKLAVLGIAMYVHFMERPGFLTQTRILDSKLQEVEAFARFDTDKVARIIREVIEAHNARTEQPISILRPGDYGTSSKA